MGAWAQPHTPTQGCGWVSWMDDGSRETPPSPGLGRGLWDTPRTQVQLAWLTVLLSHSVSSGLVFLLPASLQRDMPGTMALTPLDLVCGQQTTPGPTTLPPGLPAPLLLDCEATVAPAVGCALPPSFSPSLPPVIPRTSSLTELCHPAALKPSPGQGPGLPQLALPQGQLG